MKVFLLDKNRLALEKKREKKGMFYGRNKFTGDTGTSKRKLENDHSHHRAVYGIGYGLYHFFHQ